MLPDHPRVDAARVHAALVGQPFLEAQRVERRAGAHHRHRASVPPAHQVLGEDVERVGHHDHDAREPARLHRVRGVLHDLDVGLEHVEAGLARLHVRADRDDGDVLGLELVVAPAADLGRGQERERVEVVERLAAGPDAGAVVERDAPGEALHDERAGGGDAHSPGSDDPHAQPGHRRRLPIGHGRTLPRMARIDIPDGPGAPGRRVFGLRPEMAGTVTDMIDAVYHRSALPATEREVARLRVAQLNDCSACSTARAQSMLDAGVTDDDYGHLDEWRTWPGYTERQRLAIEYAERFTIDHQGLDDEFYERLHAQFADDEILDLSLCLAIWLGLGRVLAVLQVEQTTGVMADL